MTVIFGLDVSTSCIGICAIESSILPDDKGSHILLLDRIEFKKCKTLWDKADAVHAYLGSLRSNGRLRGYTDSVRIVLEEPLMGFRPGMSSAQTITTLMRFNGIVSYIVRGVFKHEPEYINAPHARKLCGIKLQKTAVGGPQKEQVFAHMAVNDLKHVTWPSKKNGVVVDWSRDATDAYVIARAAQVCGPIVPVVKKIKKATKPSVATGGTVSP
jgi:hypothetical protein